MENLFKWQGKLVSSQDLYIETQLVSELWTFAAVSICHTTLYFCVYQGLSSKASIQILSAAAEARLLIKLAGSAPADDSVPIEPSDDIGVDGSELGWAFLEATSTISAEVCAIQNTKPCTV